MKSQRKIAAILLSVVMIISAVIGYNSLNPSKPNYDDLSKVNVNNQVNHIKEIAKEPHSIFDDEAHKKVREYLVSELDKLGVDTKLYEYEDVFIERTETKEDLTNIYGEIKGQNDSYIMLVTHYDSSHAKTERYAEEDGSFGAADAGYALSTILETIRVIKESDTELVNGIKVLITDGEEYGLVGAKEAVKEEEIFENVNYLVNIEARGTKGPAIMFETSPNNSGVIDLYESAEKPFSYSITPEIYRLLPNATDFTVFLENEITGINISVLDGLENYHTPNDSIENISEKSLQHYGDQILPVVKEFVTNEKYSEAIAFDSNEDSIFFILGNVFIKYSKTINYVLLAAILVMMILIYKKANITSASGIFKYSGLNLAYTLASMGVAYGVTRVVAMLNGRDFKLTYLPLMKFEYAIILIFIIVAFVGYILFIKKFTNDFEEKYEFILGSMILFFVIGLALTFALPGGSYLLVFPMFLITLFTLINLMLSNEKLTYIMLLPLSLIVILYVPTVYLFNCALTFGALSVNMFFVMIALTSIMCCSIQIKDLVK